MSYDGFRADSLGKRETWFFVTIGVSISRKGIITLPNWYLLYETRGLKWGHLMFIRIS